MIYEKDLTVDEILYELGWDPKKWRKVQENLYIDMFEDKAFYMIDPKIRKIITFYPWEGQRP